MTEQQAFDTFWASWPKRVKKQAARDAFHWAWGRHNKDGKLLDVMLSTIAWQRPFYCFPQFLPDPNRWLLDCRWEDENPAVAIEARHAEDRQRQRDWMADRNARPDMAAEREREFLEAQARKGKQA